MRPSTGAISWLGAVLALYLLSPLAVFIARLAAPGEHGFTEPGLWSALGTSVVASSISTAIALVFGVPLAHWLAVSESRVARAVGVLVQLPLALPPVMSGIVLIYVVGPYTPIGELFGGRLTDSLAGVVIAQTFVASPFLVIGARSAFRRADPSLGEVAAGLGHGVTARFFRVAVPAASDGIRAAVVLTWLRALGEYGATALLAYHPYTLPVFVNVQFQSAGLPTAQAPTALALALAVLAVVVGIGRRPRPRTTAVLPTPRAPGRRSSPELDFRVKVVRGAFRLEVRTDRPSRRIAILGPSGAGKTLTLRAIGGSLRDAADIVRVGAGDVAALAAERRSIGYVAQGGVLQPRRTVWKQALFGVGTDPAVASWWLRTLRVDHLASRRPDELSGGERQRVALAQVLSREPAAILLDEPFSALDGPIRDELRAEFRRLQRDRSLSTIVVTHDPTEAAYLADHVIVLDGGAVLQQGPLADVFRAPVSTRVARLVGLKNVNEGIVAGDGVIRVGGIELAATGVPTGSRAGQPVLWSIPVDGSVFDATERSGAAPGGGSIPVTVIDVVDLGDRAAVEADLDGGGRLVVDVAPGTAPGIGETRQLHLPVGAVRAWRRAD